MQKVNCYIAGVEILIPLIAPLSQMERPHFHAMGHMPFFFLPRSPQGQEILAACRSSRFQESKDVMLAGIDMVISVKLAF